MPTMSQDFIRKCEEAIRHNWEKDTPPDPAGVEDLFEWFDQNVANIRNIPDNPFIAPGSRASIVTFKDDSTVSIRHNPLSNQVVIMDQTRHPQPEQGVGFWLDHTTRADYVLFAHIVQRQKAAAEAQSHPC